MCGRTVCSLAPDQIVQACSYCNNQGKMCSPKWTDAPQGQTYSPSYNIAPGAYCPVLVSGKHFNNQTAERVITPMKWGLTQNYSSHNCRMDTPMQVAPTFKRLLEKGNRCVVIMEGFFEWKDSKDGKQPYFFHFPQPVNIQSPVSSFCKEEKIDTKLIIHDSSLKQDLTIKVKIEPDIKTAADSSEHQKSRGELFFDKAIKSEIEHGCSKYGEAEVKNVDLKVKAETKVEKTEEGKDRVKVGDKRKLEETSTSLEEEQSEWHCKKLLTVAGLFDKASHSYTVITVSSSTSVKWCHHRMPAILANEEEVQAWLDFSKVPQDRACRIISPKDCLTYYPVSKYVNSSKNNGRKCVVKEIQPSKKTLVACDLRKWMKPV